jgi:hypothetical protein
MISTILLIRFTLNIYKIIRLIGKSTILNSFKTQIVLVEHKTLPYSFLRYIFVNRSDYENGKIEKQLIIHEQTHCFQNHSVDIIIIELVKIVLWFNPLLWLFRKAIQLNHEFLADNKVLSIVDLREYQNTLINLVFRNNSTYLASNFDYSLTKKRLIMMTKNDPLKKTVFLKIAAIPLFLILGVTLTFSQENIPKGNLMNYQNEWWYPILIKHKIEPGAFNNFENIFETGTKNSINNRVVTIENAIFIIKYKTNDYTILKSPLAFHDLKMKSISGAEGTYKTYNFKSRKLKTSGTLKDFKYTFKEDGKTSLAAKEWKNKSK